MIPKIKTPNGHYYDDIDECRKELFEFLKQYIK